LKINNEGWDPRSLQRNLERLLAHGYDPNVRNHRSSRANFTILHHLAAKACNPGAYGHTATEIVDFARVLIDAGADPNALEDQLQSTPLGWAARIGNGELVDYLLSRGADPNRAGADWSRPLAWAKKKGHGEIATLLSTQGAEG
jgi:ankyrin repeat protein